MEADQQTPTEVPQNGNERVEDASRGATRRHALLGAAAGFGGVAVEALLNPSVAGAVTTVNGYYDVTDPPYSAKPGDGVGDQAAAFQSAIDDAAAAGGGTVYVPPVASGTWYRVSHLLMKSNVRLIGAGAQSYVRATDNNSNAYLIELADNTVVNTWIVGLQLACTKLNQTQPTFGCILYSQSSTGDRQHRFLDLWITSFNGDGMHFAGAMRASYLQNVYITNCDGNGMVFEAGATDNVVVGCMVGFNGLNNYVSDASTNRFLGCKAYRAGQKDSTQAGDGFQMTGIDSIGVGCEAQSNLRHGFNFSTAQRALWGNCSADMNSAVAFAIDNTTDSIISGNAVGGADPANGGPHQHIAQIGSGVARVRMDIGYESKALVTGNAPVTGTATDSEIDVKRMGHNDSSPAFTASFTPDPYLSQTVRLTLTGNITINKPTVQHRGRILRFVLAEDAAGNHSITFDPAYKKNATLATGPNKTNVITFQCDGSNWIQVAAATGL